MFTNTVSNNTESNNDPESNYPMSNYLKSNLKMRFFGLFIENKNQIKQGLHLQEICQTRLGRRTSRRIVMVTTDRHGLRRPILMQFLLLLFFITLDDKYDGPS